MTPAELLQRYAAGERDFSGVNLSGANLERAYLRGANLNGANLEDAYLRGANLSGADLENANLNDADLRGANLSGANLSGANLSGANLSGANLSGANLRCANLRGANLRGANLTDTCLDPAAPLPPLTDEEITAAGLEIRGETVWGWRTACSLHVGSQEYTPRPEPYVAPVFSLDPHTACHPGIYLDGLEAICMHLREYRRPANTPLTRAYCLRSELLHARKWRAKRVWIPAEGQGEPYPEVQT